MRPEPVDRPAEPVEHAAEQRRGQPDLQRVAERDDVGAGGDPAQLAQRHQQHFGIAETDGFGQHRLGRAPIDDLRRLADRHRRPVRFDDRADDLTHLAVGAQQIRRPQHPEIAVCVERRGAGDDVFGLHDASYDARAARKLDSRASAGGTITSSSMCSTRLASLTCVEMRASIVPPSVSTTTPPRSTR